MKSKNAATRGVCRCSGAASTRQIPCQLVDRPENAHEIGLGVTDGQGQRREAHPRLRGMDQPENAVVARGEMRVRRDATQPDRGAMTRQAVVEADEGVAREILDPPGRAALFEIPSTGVNGPERIADLAAHEFAIPGIARTQGDIGLAFHQVEETIAHHELDA